MNSGRLRAAVVIGLIVLCSVLAGAAVERTVIQKVIVRRRPPPLGATGPAPFTREQDARRRTEMLDRMEKELTLSSAQRAGIDSVMWHTDSLLHGIRVEMQPRLSKVLADSRAEIDKRLDADQRTKFDKMTAERRLRRP